MTEKTFHGLRLIADCGGGAYGEVWYCEDLSGRRMAVKIISKTRLGDVWKRELQGVINYRRITENSPCLLRIFHVAEDEEHFYYTMEAADSASGDAYVPDTLARRLQAGPLPPDQLFPVLAGIYNGLATIHQAGFAHRDIKPDNILFVGGVPKLADIGLVSSLSNSLTRLAGTLEFLPPEERGGETPASTDRVSRQRNDLYAFGKVVYCAATGLEPGRFPSLPTSIRLSIELKLFMRLALKLCARESRLRINDLAGLYRELTRIERQLRSGETLTDRVRCACGSLARSVCAALLTLGRALRKTWWLVLFMVLAASLAGYRLHSLRQRAATTRERKEKTVAASKPPHQPPPVKSPAKPPETPPAAAPVKPQETPSRYKTYSIASLGLTMRVPRQWQIMSDDYIRAQIDEMTRELNETKKGEEAKNYLRHAIAKAKTWKGMIRCDLYDTIEIAHEPPGAHMNNLWTLPEERLRREILAQCGAPEEKNAEVYEVKRMMLAGRRCVVADFTADRHDRIKNCMLLDDSGIVFIALTADAATFDRRVKEFDAMLATLEFSRPATRKVTAPAAEPKPQPHVETREVTDPRGRFTIRIPTEWKVLPEDFINRLLIRKSDLAQKKAPSPVERAQLHALSQMVENRGTLIYCDFDDGDRHDDVEITPDINLRKAEVWHLTDAELRRQWAASAAEKGVTDFAVYDAKHTEFSGRSAILLECSNDPRNVRSLVCIVFTGEDSSLQLALTARNGNYPRLRPMFETMLTTLKIPPRENSGGVRSETVKTPAPPKAPPDPNTREYVNRRHRFTMRIPLHWELMSKRFVEQLRNEKRAAARRGGKDAKIALWQAETLDDIIKNDGACFRCNFDPVFNDCVDIIPSDLNKDGIWNFSEEYLRSQFQLEAMKQSVPFAVYDLRRAEVGGKDCLVMECSSENDEIHKLIYVIFVGRDKSLTVAVSAKRANFARRKREFEAVMRTLNFTK